MNDDSDDESQTRSSVTSLVEYGYAAGNLKVDQLTLSQRKWPEERITIDLEPIPGFNLRAQVVGHGGAYVKHIQQETRCRVQIKGRNSGFMEHGTGRESDEPMYLHVAFVFHSHP